MFLAPRKGANEVLRDPTSAETPFAPSFDFGRPRILTIFLRAVFFPPKVLNKVAGRRRKDRNIVIRFVAPRKGANEVLRDPTSVETPFTSYFGFGRPRILRFFLTAVFFQPKVRKQAAAQTHTGSHVVLRFLAPHKRDERSTFLT